MPLVQIFIWGGRQWSAQYFWQLGGLAFGCSRPILILNHFSHTSQIHPSAGILSESLCAMGHVRQYCQCFTFVFPHLAHKHKLCLPKLTLEMFSQSQDPSCLLPTSWTLWLLVQDPYHQCVLQWEVSDVTQGRWHRQWRNEHHSPQRQELLTIISSLSSRLTLMPLITLELCIWYTCGYLPKPSIRGKDGNHLCLPPCQLERATAGPKAAGISCRATKETEAGKKNKAVNISGHKNTAPKLL